jgi:hypothetical protein
LPHGKIMLSFSSNPIWWLNRSRHSLQITNNKESFIKFKFLC